MYVHHLGLYCILFRRFLISTINIALQLTNIVIKESLLLLLGYRKVKNCSTGMVNIRRCATYACAELNVRKHDSHFAEITLNFLTEFCVIYNSRVE